MSVTSLLDNGYKILADKLISILIQSKCNFKRLKRIICDERTRLVLQHFNPEEYNSCERLPNDVAKFLLLDMSGLYHQYVYDIAMIYIKLLMKYNNISAFKWLLKQENSRKKLGHFMQVYYFHWNPKFLHCLCKFPIYGIHVDYDDSNISVLDFGPYLELERPVRYIRKKLDLRNNEGKQLAQLDSFVISHRRELADVIISKPTNTIKLKYQLVDRVLKKFTSRNLAKLIKFYI